MKPCKREGVTIIELLLTIALFSLVILVGFSLLNLSSKPLAIANQEVDLQSYTRSAITTIIDYIEKASAIFIHGDIENVFTDNDIYPPSKTTSEVIKVDEDFIGSKNMSKKSEFLSALEKYKGWNFIVLSEDGKELREFIYREDNNKGYYELRRLIKYQSIDDFDITFDIDFKLDTPSTHDNYLAFTLIGKDSKRANPMEITTKVHAYNSLQVVDRSGYKPGKVLFFKENLDSKAAVAMVLDTSGSMRYDTIYEGSTIKKIEALKISAKNLINTFVNLDNVSLSLIPFNASANGPGELKSVRASISDLKERIEKLEANGGTNIGDGIRRAYHILKKFNDASVENEEANKYLIIIMDGLPTYGTIDIDNRYTSETRTLSSNMGKYYIDESLNVYEHYKTEYILIFLPYRWHYRKVNFYLSDGDINENTDLVGSGSLSEDNYNIGLSYVSEIGEKLNDIKNLKVFLVGFFTESGNQDKDLEMHYFEEIKKALRSQEREVDGFIANDGDKLNLAITEIEESIIGEYWRIFGPRE